MKNKLHSWGIFAIERFAPTTHLPMVALFFLAHCATWAPIALGPFPLIALSLGTLAFFFKLRLYDEIKDLDTDRRFNPSRPLVRGVLSCRDLRQGIALCIGVELATFAAAGIQALAFLCIAICYSLLMYREFYAAQWLRPHLTTYAVSHTFISVLLSFALSAALSGHMAWSPDGAALRLGLSAWCLFNLFEFGRKTFASSEEREGVDSYSRIFGRFGAVALVALMGLGAAWLLGGALPWIGALVLTLVGLVYAALDCFRIGALYRALSSTYIALVYAGLLLTSQLSR